MQFTLNNKQIDISAPTGGNGILHLLVDRYYRGTFVRYRGAWDLRAHKDDHGFSVEDINFMLKEVEREFG